MDLDMDFGVVGRGKKAIGTGGGFESMLGRPGRGNRVFDSGMIFAGGEGVISDGTFVVIMFGVGDRRGFLDGKEGQPSELRFMFFLGLR